MEVWVTGRTMAEKKSIVYAFRRPRFPLICEIDGCLFGARDSAEFRRRLARFDLPDVKEFKAIDAGAEEWMFLPDKVIVAPRFVLRPARKIEIIRWFNESRTAREACLSYPERVIGNRRLDRIVQDIVELLPRPR